MGQWISCQICAGTGTLPCSGEGETQQCPHCGGQGTVSCDSYSECEASYMADHQGQDEYEFVYDEY